MSSNTDDIRGIGSDRFIRESLSTNLFWLRIMKEHSLFLRLGLPCDRRDLIERAMFFEAAYSRLLERAQRISTGGSPGAVRELNDESIRLTEMLIQYKTDLLLQMLECRLGGFNYPLLIDHIRREAIHFVNLLTQLQTGEMLNPVSAVVMEEVFWLRIMADHSKLIQHLLDPSERQLVQIADEFGDKFDMLRFQAEDFESFLQINPIFVPSLRRFNNDVMRATTNLRDFKTELRNMIAKCEVVSLIPELLADHVLREAERFLEILRSIQVERIQ
jgi:hypothetical protein